MPKGLRVRVPSLAIRQLPWERFVVEPFWLTAADPTLGNIFSAGIAQLVERHLAKVDVAGSSPVSRSLNQNFKLEFICV